jgi:hypothetical protein
MVNLFIYFRGRIQSRLFERLSICRYQTCVIWSWHIQNRWILARNSRLQVCFSRCYSSSTSNWFSGSFLQYLIISLFLVFVCVTGGCTYTSGGAHAHPQHLKTPHTILFISILHLLDNWVCIIHSKSILFLSLLECT